MISEGDKERVRQATDFQALVSETVVLRQRGRDFWGCCPFHHEKSPSFHINPSTGLWNCFGCHKGGDVFDYVMAREHLEFADAIRYLADRAGIELAEEQGGQRGPKRNRLQEALRETERYYAMMLMRGRGEGPESARRYFAGRGFGADVCKRWGLGFAPGRGQLVQELKQKGFSSAEMEAADVAVMRSGRLSDRFYDRVIFPIRDEQGRTIGFGGRVLTDAKPKYLNTKETRVFHKSKNLFGIDQAKESITAQACALVVEGYTDVISLHEHGFTHAVAALGTALSLDHVRTLSRYGVSKIICMFDGDAAGQKAAELSVHYVDKTDAEMLCVVLPGGQDPMEYLAEHPASDLQEILDHARPLVEFVLERKLASFDLRIPGQKASALTAAAEVLAPLVGSVSFDGYATGLAYQLDTDLETTKRAVRAAAQRANARESSEPPSQAPVYTNGSNTTQTTYPAPNSILSLDAREQLAAERELLSLLAAEPDAVRPLGDRLGAIVWADSRHETMCWAMLAAPSTASAADLVAAATAAVPEAPRILSSGGLALAHDMDAQHKVSFLVDVLELYSTRREIRQIQGQLRQRDNANNRELLSRALELRRRETELNQLIPLQHC